MNEATDKLDESFEDKLTRAKGVDHDMALVLADNWQRVLGSFLAVLLAVWVYGEYKSAKENKVSEASKRFQQVHETLVKLQAGGEKPEQLAKLLTDNVTALKTTYDGTSYSELAELYEASSLRAQGKFEEAEKSFTKLYQLPSSKELDRNDLIKELAGLGLARTLIDGQKEKEAETVLSQLIKTSKVINVEALVAFARVSDQHDLVEGLAIELKNSRPELAEQVDREMVNFGISLEK